MFVLQIADLLNFYFLEAWGLGMNAAGNCAVSENALPTTVPILTYNI